MLPAAAPRNSTAAPGHAGPGYFMQTRESVRFRYDGATALTVLGPVTQSRYRFAFAGATVEVDARDAPSVAAVPHLRRCR